MDQIIPSLGLATADLKNSDDAYWRQQALEDANWRIAYVTRHKGAHEAHRYDIVEIERIAKAVITCYLLAARHVLRDPKSRAKAVELSSTIERLNGLLTARASTYRLTHDLPKTLEHLQLYQARRDLSLDDEKRHLLFHSFLHGNGPTYFFVRGVPWNRLIKWAQELLGRADDGATSRPLHFIHDAGGTTPLTEIIRSFRSYAHRHKLAFYLNRYSEDGGIASLWSLHRHKARVVQAAVANALSRRVTSRHTALLSLPEATAV